MKILALDLSTARGSVAVLENGGEAFLRDFANDRKHSGAFFEALAAAQSCCANPDRIVVGLGPGSYAGIRIAISSAVGLQLACEAELIGLPSVCAMDTPDDEFCVIGDARRQSYWFAKVERRRCCEGPLLLDELALRERLAQLEIPVYSAERLPVFSGVVVAYPSAVHLAQIASTACADQVLPPLEPIYLREPHITESKQPVWTATR